MQFAKATENPTRPAHSAGQTSAARVAFALLLSAGWAGALCLGPGRAYASMPGEQAQTQATPHARIEQFETAAQIPKSERAAVFEDYVLVFRTVFGHGDFVAATALAERATRIYPELRRPWNHLAAARMRLGRFGPAIEAARFAERADDDEDRPAPTPEESAAAAAYWEGVALYSTQRYPEALVRLRAAVARNPQWAEAQRALGECLFVSSKAADAAPAYEQAFALDPSLGSTRDLSYFAEARAAAGDVEGGIAALQEALQRAAYEPGLHAKLGDLLRRAQRPAAAYYELLYEILLHGPHGAFADPALSMQSELVKAAKETREDRQSIEIILVAGALRSVQNDELHEAVHKLQFALRDTRAGSPVPQYLFADAEERAGLHDQSRTTLQGLIAAHPNFIPAYFLLSEVETARGQPQAAEQSLQKVRDAFPNYWKLHQKSAPK